MTPYCPVPGPVAAVHAAGLTRAAGRAQRAARRLCAAGPRLRGAGPRRQSATPAPPSAAAALAAGTGKILARRLVMSCRLL